MGDKAQVLEYLNDFNRQSATNPSLASLFPYSNSMSVGSGAGRFMSSAPSNDWMANMTPMGNYTNTFIPAEFVMPAEVDESLLAPKQVTAQNLGGSLNSGSGVFANLGK